MESEVRFASAGLTLVGVLHEPKADGPRPAVIDLHGFGGSCSGAGHHELARALERAGYVVLRFDFRGCGKSEGLRGHVIGNEQVEDTQNAVTFLQQQASVDPARIGVVGASMGGTVAIHATALDPRIKVCAASGSSGNGARRFRYQYPSDDAWNAFLARLVDAQRHRNETGQHQMVPRYDIVHIPEHNRPGLASDSVMEFTAETAVSKMFFNSEAVAFLVSPRPLLVIHPRGDEVNPATEADHLAAAAGANCEKHIIGGKDHFGSGNPEVIAITIDWLARHMPPRPAGSAT